MTQPTFQNLSVTSTTQNLDQHVIVTTQDKLELALHKHAENLGQRKAWTGPLGVVLAIGCALCASEFQDALGLKAVDWKAIFSVGLVLSILWSGYAIWTAWNAPTVGALVEKIKKG